MKQDPEFVIHAGIVEILKQGQVDDVVFFHPSSGEERTKRIDPRTGKIFCPGGTRLQLMGLRKGVPDLVILKAGHVYGLEIKAPDGSLSGEQKAFRTAWERAGGVYAVVKSVSAGKQVLEQWGVLRVQCTRKTEHV